MNDVVGESGTANIKNGKNQEKSPFYRGIIEVLSRVLFALLLIVGTFTFVFGIFRYERETMRPTVQPGDLVLFFRLSQTYRKGDLVVADVSSSKDEPPVRDMFRVLAGSGSEVDIRDGAVYVDGVYQVEPYASDKTQRYEEGVDFPLRLAENEFFLLGDNRSMATDGRLFGAVLTSNIEGKVIYLLRNQF